MYWKDWEWAIWCQWVISKAHNNHSILEFDEVHTQLQDKVKGEITSLKIKEKAIEQNNTSMEFNRLIFDNVIDVYKCTLNMISLELNKQNKIYHEIQNDQLNSDYVQSWKNSEFLDLFWKSKDRQMIKSVPNILLSEAKIKSQTFESIASFEEKSKNADLCILNPINYSFTIWREELYKKLFIQKTEFILSWDSNLKVKFNEEANHEDRIQISLEFINKPLTDHFWRVELKNNTFCKLLDNNQLKRVCNDMNQVCIGILESFYCWNRYWETDTLTMSISLLIINENINNFIKSTEDKVLKEIISIKNSGNFNKNLSEQANVMRNENDVKRTRIRPICGRRNPPSFFAKIELNQSVKEE